MADRTTSAPPPSTRTRVRRKADRARYDRDSVAVILDAGLIAHVGFVTDAGVFVLPMAYARVGDHLYLHGVSGNAMLSWLATGAEVCVTVTLVDALVLSRSAFHHSMNYRSVTVVGRASPVTADGDKAAALRAIVDHTLLGRSDECRGPSASELRGTARVVQLPIAEASAKVRTGPPIEDPDDLGLPYWGGELPLTTSFGPARADEHVPAGMTYGRFHGRADERSPARGAAASSARSGGSHQEGR